MVFTHKFWRHYLYGVNEYVFSDHKIFQYVFTQKELNLCKRKRLEFVNDYDMSLHYNPSKANVVLDVHIKSSMGSVANVDEKRNELVKDVYRLACLGVHLMSILDGCVTIQYGQHLLW